nr:phospholipase A [Diaphorobacter ruginosibacter]
MTTFSRSHLCLAMAAVACGSLPALSHAQHAQTRGTPLPDTETAWRQCMSKADDSARLACFDQWSRSQPTPDTVGPLPAAETVPASGAQAQLKPPAELVAAQTTGPIPNGGCRDASFSEMSRFWELEEGTDCGTFSFRGYRPLTLQASAGSDVNRQPMSDNPANSATFSQPYDKQEMRIQLSVRTKLASGLLTSADSKYRDSLWLGYTQQSYWQLFNSDISRPFRNTDHEPEILYVYPTTADLPGGWRWRYSGVGLAHQSNGQSDPLSRSWNRYYVMTGFELPGRWTVEGRYWKRIKESFDNDNNPQIENYIGRGELKVGWNVNQQNWLGVTARGSLGGHGKGSGRIEWMRALGEGWLGGKSNLRLHASVFSGYGDSLVDYNFKRTVFSVGFSLLDF